MYKKTTLVSICSTIGKRETSELRMQNRTGMARRCGGRSHKSIIARPLEAFISYNLFQSLSYTKYTPFRCLVTGSCVCAAKRTMKERSKQKIRLCRWLCPFLYISWTLAHILLLMNCHSLLWFLFWPFSVHEHPTQGLCLTGLKVWTP